MMKGRPAHAPHSPVPMSAAHSPVTRAWFLSQYASGAEDELRTEVNLLRKEIVALAQVVRILCVHLSWRVYVWVLDANRANMHRISRSLASQEHLSIPKGSALVAVVSACVQLRCLLMFPFLTFNNTGTEGSSRCITLLTCFPCALLSPCKCTRLLENSAYVSLSQQTHTHVSRRLCLRCARCMRGPTTTCKKSTAEVPYRKHPQLHWQSSSRSRPSVPVVQ